MAHPVLSRGAVLLLVAVMALIGLGSVRPARADDDAPPADGAPVAAPLLAYYYIWFDPRSWSRAKTDFPLLGAYSSDDEAVLRQHVRWAKAAGIDGFIVSWKDTPALTSRLALLADIAAQEQFHLAIIYQGLDYWRHPLPIDQVAADLDTFVDRFAAHPAFALREKPVVIWSGTWEFTRNQIDKVAGPRRDDLLILASERSLSGFQRVADLVDGDAYYWSSGDPTTYDAYGSKLSAMADAVHAAGGIWIAPAAPGYDARQLGGTRVVERRDGGTLRDALAAAQAASPDAIGLISWNEFSENTHIEPSCDFGAAYLAIVADAQGKGHPSVAAACDEAARAAASAATRSATPVDAAPEPLDPGLDFDSSDAGAGPVRGAQYGVTMLATFGGVMLLSVVVLVRRTRDQEPPDMPPRRRGSGRQEEP